MCGRFNVHDLAEALEILFGMESERAVPPRYNIAPSQPVAVVRENPHTRARELALLQWGLIPHWSKDPAIGSRMINARSETAVDKPSFRGPLRYKRCLIPANGYYEWKKESGGKQPYLIRKPDRSPFAMAGLWEHWLGPNGEELETLVILTVAPTEALSAIHNRMPVILPRESFRLWLDTQAQQPAEVVPLLQPYTEGELVAVPVSRYVNNPRNDGPRCIEPVPPSDDAESESA